MRNRKVYQRQYYQQNKEELKAYARKWHKEHREEANLARRVWGSTHKEQQQATGKAYYQAHKEEEKEYARAFYQSHKREYMAYFHKRRTEIKLEVLTHYSIDKPPQCSHCGIVDIDVLCLDHINGGGNKQRKQLGGLSGNRFYRWLKKNNYPDGFQVLCWNCNIKKVRIGNGNNR